MVKVGERQNLGKQSTMQKEQDFKFKSILDKDGIIHVGGRLDDSCIKNNCKHPMLLPKNGKVTTLIIQHHHGCMVAMV